MTLDGLSKVAFPLELRLGSGSSFRYACAEEKRRGLARSEKYKFIVRRESSGEFLSMLDRSPPQKELKWNLQHDSALENFIIYLS